MATEEQEYITKRRNKILNNWPMHRQFEAITEFIKLAFTEVENDDELIEQKKYAEKKMKNLLRFIDRVKEEFPKEEE